MSISMTDGIVAGVALTLRLSHVEHDHAALDRATS